MNMPINMENQTMAHRLKIFNLHFNSEKRDFKDFISLLIASACLIIGREPIASVSHANTLMVKIIHQRLLPYME